MSLLKTTRLAQRVALNATRRPFSVYAANMADSSKDTSALNADKGSVGAKFNEKGSIGGTAQEVGGPFDKDGAIGKQFKKDGAIGGTGQAVAEQMQGDKPAAFDKDGMIGKHFKADGAIGQIGEMVGGPFAKDGAIGKNFNPEGDVGGKVQEELGENGKMKK